MKKKKQTYKVWNDFECTYKKGYLVESGCDGDALLFIPGKVKNELDILVMCYWDNITSAFVYKHDESFITLED